MGWSKQKLYYGLKVSQAKRFEMPSRYLKEGLNKESQFEKPYRDLQYNQMHLNIPPNFPDISDIPDFYPDGDPYRIFIYSEPTCSIHTTYSEISEEEPVYITGNVVIKAPASGTGWQWEPYAIPNEIYLETVYSSLENKYMGWNAYLIGDELTTTEFCMQVTWSGEITKVQKQIISSIGEEQGLTIEPGEALNSYPTSIGQAIGQSPYYEYEVLERQSSGPFDCGCINLESGYDPCDDVASVTADPSNPETISRDSSITLIIAGGLPPYSWGVDESGFSLEYSTTTGLSNILYADSTVCGTAKVRVTSLCPPDSWTVNTLYSSPKLVRSSTDPTTGYNTYRCIQGHLSDLTNRPPNGADWEDYWQAAPSNGLIIIVRSDEGQWTQQTGADGYCTIPGPSNAPDEASRKVRIVGEEKNRHLIQTIGTSVSGNCGPVVPVPPPVCTPCSSCSVWHPGNECCNFGSYGLKCMDCITDAKTMGWGVWCDEVFSSGGACGTDFAFYCYATTALERYVWECAP